jgi:hypothetical protein
MKYSIISTTNGEHLGEAHELETAKRIGLSYADWNIACSVVDSVTGESMAMLPAFRRNQDTYTAYASCVPQEPGYNPEFAGSRDDLLQRVGEEDSEPKVRFKLGFRGGRPATLKDLQAEVGPGWSDIIARLVRDLRKLGWNGEVVQMKEKFGGLRFYINDTSDALHDRIEEAAADYG